MAYRVNESADEQPMAKKVMWEEEVDSSDDEEDHSFYFETPESQSYWYCSGCKTCITRECVVDSNNLHFQLNKATGVYYPTSVTMDGKILKLIIHRGKDMEIFGYFSASSWGSS